MATPYTRLINPYQNLQSTAEKKVEVVDLPKNNATVSVIGQTTKNPVVAPTPQQKTAAATTIPSTGEVTNISKQISALNTAGLADKANIKYAQSRGWSPILPTTQTTQMTPLTSTGITGDSGGTTEQKQKTTPTYGIQETKPISTINTLQQQLANIQSQIAARQTEAEQAKINLMAGQTALEGQGRAIPLSLIRGQQAKLQTQAGLDELTKATELAGLQRQEAGLISQLQSQQQLAQPLTAGNEIIRYNPDTGQYETIYRGVENISPMKIVAGETIVDPTTGKIIYQAPAKATDTLENQKKILEIQKLQQDIESSNSGVERDMKQAQLAKLMKELEGAPEISPYQAERATRTIESVDGLLNRAMQTPEIFGASAALPVPDYLRSDAFRNYRSELDTLKANIAFSELTAMREASKTGGALGQVSDREGQLLQSALGALSMDQSPENVILQLQKIKDSINRWKEAIEMYGETGEAGEYSW